ncbi:sensor domain-containing diguanylate cyclase [Mitsuokella multacida]|uniref:sensor domain-containing diguanylate cyclase n=1 Tax=Mitsuokella multacida TaxID=52226 RepID=UPI00265F521F|nr:sensor domain-containing diguanylate cyclase [Mitsuokella multacida]
MENNWMPDVYSDVPVAYAVFDLIFAEDGKTVQDTKYVFVNKIYCEMVGKTEEELLGNSFRSIYEKVNPIWMTYCARVCHEGKAIRDCIYAPEIDHWLDFTIMPLAQPGYVAYTFMNVDLDRARQMEMKREYTTNDIILRISKILSGEEEYDVAMNHALRELSRVLHPDRLYILETDGKTVSNTFEWCAPGVAPEIDTLQNLDYAQYIGGWEKFLEHSTSVIIEDIEVLKDDDSVDYWNLKRQGIERIIDAPFYHDGELIGYLGVDNYEKSELVNTVTVLETVSYFIASKITNYRLMAELEHASCYDALTGLHNRNACIEKIDFLMQHSSSIGIVYADVNGLKEINDTRGHQAGDEALKRAAHLLAKCYGSENAYRMGGDEFLVLMPLVKELDFKASFRRLRELVGREQDLSIALGSDWVADTTHLNEAICRTDQRMYSDKVEFYNRRGKKHESRHDLNAFRRMAAQSDV